MELCNNDITYLGMTVQEMEKEQERLHERFERLKTEIHDRWIEMGELSESYNNLENEINKLKENKNGV